MSFFNKTEEVIDLVMTRKGREMFSKGKFKPTYYAFSDDEVIYDLKYADSSSLEAQNDSITRIDKSVFIKNQTDWQLAKTTGLPQRDIEPLFKELGTSSPVKQLRPSWDLRVKEGFISGSFSGSVDNKMVNFTPPEYNEAVRIYEGVAIPQIDIFCDYELYVVGAGNGPQTFFQHKGEEFSEERIMLLATSSKNIMLELQEKNVDSPDFELEVFQYDYDKAGTPDLKRLHFTDDRLESDVVSYFFDVTTDIAASDLPSIKFVEEPIADQFVSKEDDC